MREHVRATADGEESVDEIELPMDHFDRVLADVRGDGSADVGAAAPSPYATTSSVTLGPHGIL